MEGTGGTERKKIYFLSHSYMFKAFALHFPWVGIPLPVSSTPKLENFAARYQPEALTLPRAEKFCKPLFKISQREKCFSVQLNLLKRKVYCMCHLLWHGGILHFTQKVNLCVPYDVYNKQELLPWTALTVWPSCWGSSVFPLEEGQNINGLLIKIAYLSGGASKRNIKISPD